MVVQSVSPRVSVRLLASAAMIAGLCAAAPATALAQTAPAAAESSPETSLPTAVDVVTVTASTANLIGGAVTSSQGVILKKELELRPVYRVGQLLETMPGLQVTAHSGEGKANQYLLRGFNLDHGHDLASYIDGMPVNMRTHAHGQGYTDLNFFIPEMAGKVGFTKGPYYASEGDFGVVGADHISYVDQIRNQLSVSAGTLGDQRVFAAGTHNINDNDRVLGTAEYVHLDGPWTHPDNFRKTNLLTRFAHGDSDDGYAITGMYYRGLWTATTDQPLRAIKSGLIGRYDTLDPSDGGQAERLSLSGSYAHGTLDWKINANAYAVKNQLTLWNNFTHFLDDPINGDQHGQNDARTYIGGGASYTRFQKVMDGESDTTVGVQGRYDDIAVDLRHTLKRQVLQTNIADRVQEGSLAVYAENTTYWRTWLRTVAGLRGDYFTATDHNVTGGRSGSENAALLQPKGSVVFGPWNQTEFYISAGQGFHSNDVRTGLVVDPVTGRTSVQRPPFIVHASGEEIGLRTTLIPHVQAAVTLFQTDFDSELTYNADAGADEAGRPSRRQGVEITAQYRPYRWLELSTNIALSKARYRDSDPAGSNIPDSPGFVASVGVLVDNLGPWFGAMEFRDLGSHPLIEDNSVKSPGYQEVNVDIGYKITPSLKLQVNIFNLFDSKQNAADYLYTDRLRGEPAAGVEDSHIHPLEPRSARFTITKLF